MDPEPNGTPAEAPTPPAPPKGLLAEKMGEKLRESARRRRPSRLVLWLLALTLLGLVGAAAAWWFWPGPEAADPVVVAYDQLSVAGVPLTLRARLEAPGDVPPLTGVDLSLTVHPIGAPAWEGKAATDSRGLASLTWGEGKAGRLTYVARYVDAARRREAQGSGRGFVVPARTDIALVDVGSLTEAGESLGSADGPADAPLLPGAAEALAELAKRKFTVVYLAMRPARAAEYGRLRDWVERQAGRLPDGPVLGSGSVEWRNDEPLRRVKQLLEEFEGKRVVIAADAGTLSRFRWEGFWVRQVSVKGGGWKGLAGWLDE